MTKKSKDFYGIRGLFVFALVVFASASIAVVLAGAVVAIFVAIAVLAVASVKFGCFGRGCLFVHFVAELLVYLFEKSFVRNGFEIGASVLVFLACFENDYALVVKTFDFLRGKEKYIPFSVELRSADVREFVGFAGFVEKFDYFFLFAPAATAVAIVFMFVFVIV